MDTTFYVGFGICALIAGIFDFLFYRIPNLFVIILIGLFFTMLLVSGYDKFSLFSFVIAITTLAVCFIFYICGWLGAGDVKFISAATLWAVNINALAFFLSISLAGGILALIYIIFSVYIDQTRLILIAFLGRVFKNSQFFKRYSEEPFIYATTFPKKKTKIPYGVAVTFGCFLVTYLAIFGGLTS